MTDVAQKKLWDIHIPTECDSCAKFLLFMLTAGLAKECDGCQPTVMAKGHG